MQLTRIDFFINLTIFYTLIYIISCSIETYKKKVDTNKSYNTNMAGNRQQFEYIVNIYIYIFYYIYMLHIYNVMYFCNIFLLIITYPIKKKV